MFEKPETPSLWWNAKKKGGANFSSSVSLFWGHDGAEPTQGTFPQKFIAGLGLRPRVRNSNL